MIILKGKFVTFEGLDHCGKTTLIHKLGYTLRDFKYYSDPSHEVFDGHIREWLQFNHLNDEAELFLYLASRALLAEKIKEDMDNGINVICDRWADSTLVYQGYFKNWYDKIPLPHFSTMNRIATLGFRDEEDFCGLVPDLTIFLDTPIEICQSRLQKNAESKYDKKMKNLANLKRVRESYLFLIKQDVTDRWAIIDGYQDIDSITNQTIQIIKERLCL